MDHTSGGNNWGTDVDGASGSIILNGTDGSSTDAGDNIVLDATDSGCTDENGEPLNQIQIRDNLIKLKKDNLPACVIFFDGFNDSVDFLKSPLIHPIERSSDPEIFLCS